MIREPSSDECTRNTKVPLREGEAPQAVAAWYPQMGGYVAKCLIVSSGSGGCFEAFVWHDGEFPFSDANPAEIHHCSAGQFIEFGHLVKRIEKQMGAAAVEQVR